MINLKIVEICQKYLKLTDAVDEIITSYPPNHAIHTSSKDSVRMCITKVLQTEKKLRGEKKRAYLQEEFCIPQKRVYSQTVLLQKVENQKETITSLKKLTVKLENENIVLKSKNEEIVERYNLCLNNLNDIEETAITKETFDQLQVSYDEQSNKLHDVLQELSSLSPRNAYKKIKRRDEKINQLRNELMEKENETSHLSFENQKLYEEINKINKDRLSLQKSRWHYRKQSHKIMQQLIDDKNVLLTEIDSLKKSHKYLEQLTEVMDTLEIETFYDGTYTDEVREVCYELLNLGVGVKNVSHVVKIVLTKLARAKVGRLPSQTLLTTMFIESKILSQLHAAEQILKDRQNICCLHTDGTSKYGEHFGSVQVTTPNGQFSLGLADMDSGTSESYLECIQNIFKDMSSIVSTSKIHENRCSENDILSKLIMCIKNIQTDRHIVNTKLTDLLTKWRQSVIEEFGEFDLSKINDEEKLKLFQINQFNCLLHFLVNLATQAEEALKNWENLCGKSGTKSQTIELIRTICKTFQKHGSEQAGVMAVFAAFLDEKCHLSKFKGNRFNIVFHNGAAAFFHLPAMRRFFKVWGTPNLLLQAVSRDIEDPVLVSGLRALGIIDKIITGPLWRIINKCSNIMAALPYLDILKTKLESWSTDATGLLTGDQVFDVNLSTADELAHNLFKETNDESFDVLTQEALELICTHFLLSIYRCTEDMKQTIATNESITDEAQIVPPTNVVSERDFAGLDRLIRERPNARTINIEATVLYLNNKTATWITTLSPEEKKKYFEECKTKAPSAIKKYHERKQIIAQRKRERFKKIEEDRLRKENNKREEIRKVIADIKIYGGEWLNKENMDKALHKLKSVTQQKNATFIQLKYHKLVLKSEAESCLFARTKSGKSLSLTTMKENLMKVISKDLAPASTSSSEENKTINLSASERNEKLKMLKAVVVSKLTTVPKIKKTKSETKKETLVNKETVKKRPKVKKIAPEELVSRYVEHTFEDSITGSRVTFYGTIVELVEEDQDNPTNSRYLIEYDVEESDDEDNQSEGDEPEPETTFEYNLLEDYYNGDLKLLD